MDEIWNKREKSNFYFIEEDEKIEVQRFINFYHNTNELKSNKYVGFIHFEDHKINLLPKIFFDKMPMTNDSAEMPRVMVAISVKRVQNGID